VTHKASSHRSSGLQRGGELGHGGGAKRSVSPAGLLSGLSPGPEEVIAGRGQFGGVACSMEVALDLGSSMPGPADFRLHRPQAPWMGAGVYGCAQLWLPRRIAGVSTSTARGKANLAPFSFFMRE